MDKTLLILGGPGAGKTTLLLELARELLARAEQDQEYPLPVVFNLSSWAARRRPLAEWLVEELRERYVVPRNLGEAWVRGERILPLLDGLDEVRSEYRESCVQTINVFRQQYGFLPLVVCSRVADYEALSQRLRLQGAIIIQPLTRSQVVNYLRQAGRPLAGVRAALRADPTLWELLESPLLLSIVTLAYPGKSAAGLKTAGTPDERRMRLFAAYTEEMFKRRAEFTRYKKQQTLRWLTWLARSTVQHNQTVFHLEWMQPYWLPTRLQQWAVTSGVAAIFGLLAVLPWLLSAMTRGHFTGLSDRVLYALAIILLGVPIGLAGYDKIIKPAEKLQWSWSAMWQKFRGRWLSGLTVGVLFCLLGGLASWGEERALGLNPSFAQTMGSWVLWGLLFGSLFGLLLSLLGGLTGQLSETRTTPNEGIRRSAHNALILGSLSGVGGGLITVFITAIGGKYNAWLLGFIVGVLVGIVAALQSGGRAYFQHLMLRILLVRNRAAPWNYVKFLEYAVSRLFLRKVGGGYIFVHRLLADYLATHVESDADRKGDSSMIV